MAENCKFCEGEMSPEIRLLRGVIQTCKNCGAQYSYEYFAGYGKWIK